MLNLEPSTSERGVCEHCTPRIGAAEVLEQQIRIRSIGVACFANERDGAPCRHRSERGFLGEALLANLPRGVGAPRGVQSLDIEACMLESEITSLKLAQSLVNERVLAIVVAGEISIESLVGELVTIHRAKAVQIREQLIELVRLGRARVRDVLLRAAIGLEHQLVAQRKEDSSCERLCDEKSVRSSEQGEECEAIRVQNRREEEHVTQVHH